MTDDDIHYTNDGEAIAGITCIRCGSHAAERVDVSDAGSMYECPECGGNWVE